MPSAQPLPTIAALTKAAHDALTGERDRYGDAHTGSLYDHAAGPIAVLLSREADADRDNFRAIYFDDADGDDLTTLIQGRYATVPGVARILDTYGVGSAVFSRSSAAAGAGTFWAGTRVQMANGAVYQVATDTTVLAAQTVATIPIRATVTGTGAAGSFQGSGSLLLDPLYDPLWLPQSLTCADGTVYEDAKSYRARVRVLLANGRNGYLPQMLSAVQAAGAQYLVTFPSNYGLATTVFTDADTGGVSATVNANQPTPFLQFTSPHGLVNGGAVTMTTTGPFYTLNRTWIMTYLSPTTLAFVAPPTLNGGFYAVTVTYGAIADYGANAAYVGDANFGSTPALVNASAIALEGARVLGADLLVGGIQTVALAISVLVYLVDDPSRIDTVPVTRAITQALLAQFSGLSAGYTYKRAGLAGAIAQAHGAVQTASIPATWVASTQYSVGATVFSPSLNGQVYQCTQSGFSSSSAPNFPTLIGATVADGGCIWQCTPYPTLGIRAGGALQTVDPTLSPSNWPATLNRYTLAPQNIAVTFAPPI